MAIGAVLLEKSMGLTRRTFLSATAATAISAGEAGLPARASAQAPDLQDWKQVRELFDLSDGSIHMSAMLISSHPLPVREAIDEHRRGLDADPVRYLEQNDEALTGSARQAAADYLGVQPSNVALTDSTTMGIGLAYNGIGLGPDDDILTSTEDYFVTHEALR